MIQYRGEPTITSSVLVYTKVLVDNLNDIKRYSFSDWLLLKDMLKIIFNPFNLMLKGMK